MEAYNRANNFLRVTEVKPFTTEHQHLLSKYIKSIIEQIDIHMKAQPKNYEERLQIIENLFKTFMEYPEFLSKYPKFRNAVIDKINEINSEIKSVKLPESQILSDANYYMSMISARPDYIKYNCFIHEFVNTPSIPEDTAKLTYHYNLRPRNKRMKYN